ncbi:MAG: thiol:disulfide interchange protein DsbA/DsbL [Gammaproteobacteria bacterium]|nr:thiol:disulfide interchange protein DsbA/DsbL [Gammaproteobacteria bacterium]
MLRTVIAKTFPAAAVLSTALLLAGPSSAAAADFEEGEHYERLPIPVDTRNPDQVEVVEVFSYGCIHCKNFQGPIDAWLESAPEAVDFYRMPATFNESWQALAQLFYTAEALDVTEQVHDPIFRAIHENGVNLTEPERMAELFERVAGIEPEQFNSVFNSFSVRSRVQQAHARGLTYRLSGTPTLIVDGRYRVDGRMAGGNAAMLDVVDYLVEQSRQTETAPAP